MPGRLSSTAVSAAARGSAVVRRASMSGIRSWQLDRPRRLHMTVATPGRRRSRGTLWLRAIAVLSSRGTTATERMGVKVSGSKNGSVESVAPRCGRRRYIERRMLRASPKAVKHSQESGRNPHVWLGTASRSRLEQAKMALDGREWRSPSAATPLLSTARPKRSAATLGATPSSSPSCHRTTIGVCVDRAM
jgi:hypothetical protein